MTTVLPERRKKPRVEDPQLRGRRSAPRAQLLLPGSAEGLSGHYSVKVLDVSLTGARIEGMRLPDVGRDIILRCGGIDTFGTIVWTASDRCGIQFDEPISAGDLVALRRLAESVGWRLDEKQAEADWLSGLAR